MFTKGVNQLFSATLFFAVLLVASSLSFIKFAQAATFQQNTSTATVVIAGLNVRSGPGTSYGRVATVKSGDSLNVIGQYSNCAWLKISTATIADGWVAGASRFVKLNVACTTLSAATVSTAASTGSAGQSAPAQPTVAPTLAPTSQPTVRQQPVPSSDPSSWLAPGVDPGMAAELEQKVPLKADQACTLFQNFLGRQVYVTLTQLDGSHIKEIPLEGNSEQAVCIPGGKYSVTLTAPGYNGAGGEVRFYAGKRDLFQIGAGR